MTQNEMITTYTKALTQLHINKMITTDELNKIINRMINMYKTDLVSKEWEPETAWGAYLKEGVMKRIGK